MLLNSVDSCWKSHAETEKTVEMALFPPAVLHSEDLLKKTNIKSAVKLLVFIMGGHKNECSGNRTESSQSYWLYIFSLWAHWKVLLLFSVLLKQCTKTRGGGVLCDCAFGEIILQSHKAIAGT